MTAVNKFNVPLVGILLGLISGILWGLGVVLLDKILALFPVLLNRTPIVGSIYICWLQDLTAFVIITILVSLYVNKEAIVETVGKPKSISYLLLAGLLGAPIGLTCFTVSVYYSNVGYTAAITSLFPIVTSLVAHFLLHQYLNLYSWTGIIIAVGGTILSSLTPILKNESDMISIKISIITALITSICWGLESIVVDKSYKYNETPAIFCLWFHAFASVAVYTIICVLFNYKELKLIFNELATNVPFLIYTLIHALVNTISLLCFFKAIKILKTVLAVSLNMTYSIWAGLFGLLFKTHHFSPTLLIGSIVTLIGTIVCISNAHRNKVDSNNETPNQLQSESDITHV